MSELHFERHTRGRWRAPGFEIRAVTIAGRVEYQAIAQGERYTWLGTEQSDWFKTAADARVWCEAKQADKRSNGRAR